MHSRQSGFTLVELSIVLVILGMLVGSILVGQSFIRSSEMRSALEENMKFTQALTAFRSKYQALPGDFAQATGIWGTAAACPAADSTSTTVTCNGDGNGRITNLDDYADTYYEQFRAWQHLANAQLIEGNYTGDSTSGTNNYTIGTNLPVSKLTGGGWKVITVSVHDIAISGNTDVPYTTGDVAPNTVLWLGSVYFENTLKMSGALTPEEALGLDKKIDDGKPLTGKLISQVSTTCYAASIYDLTNTTKACALIFKTGL